MKLLRTSLILTSLLFAFSCAHHGKEHKACCKSHHAAKECKSKKCKLKKSCCSEHHHKKCHKNNHCNSGNCQLKAKKKA